MAYPGPGARVEIDRLRTLRRFTDARIALGSAGESLRTSDWLDLRDAHAAAGDAVHARIKTPVFEESFVEVQSRCRDRREYLLRPDLGRRLADADAERVPAGPFDVAVVVADGLSPIAIERHAVAMLGAIDLSGLSRTPVVFVRQGRVAIADEIGQITRSRLSVILIGERPGLSASDSLGIYFTFAPRIGRTDAERNCISNIRDGGLTYEEAGRRATWIVREGLRRELTGVGLKESNPNRALPSADR